MTPGHPRTVTRQLLNRFPSDSNFETVVEEDGSFVCPIGRLKSLVPAKLWVISGVRSVTGTEEFTDCAEHLEAVRLRLFRIQEHIIQLHGEEPSAHYEGELLQNPHVPQLRKSTRRPDMATAIPPPDMDFV